MSKNKTMFRLLLDGKEIMGMHIDQITNIHYIVVDRLNQNKEGDIINLILTEYNGIIIKTIRMMVYNVTEHEFSTTLKAIYYVA